MDISVAVDAEGNQILLGVVSQSTPWLYMMNLQTSKASTILAVPPVPLQHLTTKFPIGLWVETQAWSLHAQSGHQASLIWSRKFCF